MRNPGRRHDRQYFYKYLTIGTAKVVLLNRTLRWSSPLAFNDPFDMPRKLEFDCTTKELQKALAEELARLIETQASVPPKAPPSLHFLLTLLRLMPEAGRLAVINDLRTKALKELPVPTIGFSGFQENWDDQMPKMRVLCLSETPVSTSMWAYYAETHRGAVLEFEALDEVDSPLLMARQVRYQDDPPKLPSKEEWVQSLVGHRPIDLKDFFADYQYVKSSQWAQEKEWRVISYVRPGETGLHGDHPFFMQELCRVILGAECSAADETEIRSLVEKHYPVATVVRASINQETRRIEF